eukprot:TRINITY_DN4683_c0_g2_i1.p1 TRINITY_DN4683_c0_g2~~TRINITY_DN4683_c0_g2_i1.p1  ORF type:complete len:408 (+),score=125.99 TRINITY_DN4683_c0_g2_i1:110-1333(+)
MFRAAGVLRCGFNTLNNWWSRVRECRSDEDLAFLMNQRFDTGGRLVRDARMQQERSALLKRTMEVARKQGCDVGVSTLSTALKISRQSKDRMMARHLIEDICSAKARIVPDGHLWTSVLHTAAVFAQRGDDVQFIIDRALAGKGGVDAVTAMDYEWILRMYVGSGDKAAARATYKKAMEVQTPTNPSFYHAAVDALETYDECRTLLKGMKARGMEPNATLLMRFVIVCRKSRDVENAQKVYAAAEQYGMASPKLRTTLLTVYLEAQSWGHYDALWKVIRAAGPLCEVSVLTHLKASSTRRRASDAEEVFFPYARAGGRAMQLWRVMMCVYVVADMPAAAADLVQAYIHQAMPPDGPFGRSYRELTGIPIGAVTAERPPRWLMEDAAPKPCYLPPTWAAEYRALPPAR